jgi:hypothetical protein
MTVRSPSGFPSNIQQRHTPPHVFIKKKGGKKTFSLYVIAIRGIRGVDALLSMLSRMEHSNVVRAT